MPAITDPARELSDLIKGLTIEPNTQFSTGFAQLLDVESWSSEFYQIVFTISSRIDDLMELVDQLELDSDHKAELISGLQTIQQAFGPNGLNNAFSHSTAHYLTPATVRPLSALSGLIRPIRSYPKLTEEEKDELLTMMDELIEWLEDHQLSEQDFIRQALIDGLYSVRFRLDRIEWFGWGYTLESLREVISAYMALERGFPNPGENPPADAMQKMAGKLVRSFFEKAGFAKDAVETGDFMLKAYGAVQLLLAGKSTVAGLLT